LGAAIPQAPLSQLAAGLVPSLERFSGPRSEICVSGRTSAPERYILFVNSP